MKQKKQEQEHDMCKRRIQQDFITKNKQNKTMIKKTYPKMVLNILKVMGNFIFICTHRTPNSKKFSRTFQLTYGPYSSMCAHVHPMWIKTQLKEKWDLTKS